MKNYNNNYDTAEIFPLSIKFYLYDFPKVKRQKYAVYARLILNRTKVDVSLRMQSSAEDWDVKEGKYFQKKQYCIYGNNKLSEIRNEFLRIYFDLKNKYSPSVKSIVRIFKGAASESSEMTLVSYYDLYLNEIRQLPKHYGQGVIEHYMKTRKHLVKYLAKNGWEGIRLQELKRNFIVGFEHYLLSTPNPETGRTMNGNTANNLSSQIKGSRKQCYQERDTAS